MRRFDDAARHRQTECNGAGGAQQLQYRAAQTARRRWPNRRLEGEQAAALHRSATRRARRYVGVMPALTVRLSSSNRRYDLRCPRRQGGRANDEPPAGERPPIPPWARHASTRPHLRKPATVGCCCKRIAGQSQGRADRVNRRARGEGTAGARACRQDRRSGAITPPEETIVGRTTDRDCLGAAGLEEQQRCWQPSTLPSPRLHDAAGTCRIVGPSQWRRRDDRLGAAPVRFHSPARRSGNDFRAAVADDRVGRAAACGTADPPSKMTVPDHEPFVTLATPPLIAEINAPRPPTR